MESSNTNWFLHVDLDAFFASVEQLDNPSYRGKPVIVGGKPEDKRSVVSTASYEARKFGVHSAMPTYQAYKLCPHGIYVHGRMKRYAELSYKIMNIFKDYSPDVIQMSIDEAFIDITGTEKLFGPPEETAIKIKQQVKQETGLTVSVGLATTQYLAKIASGYSKPDGFYFVRPGQETDFMLSLPLEKIWGVGKKSLYLLKSKGFKTTRDIYEADINILEFLFGKNMAAFLYDAVRGGKNEDFRREAKSHSISAETTFSDDITDIYTAETALLELSQGVFFRLLRENGYSRTAMVKIRYEDFSTVSIQETLDRNILTVDSFYETIRRIFEKKYERNRGIRLLGVGLENIENQEKPYQQDLFDNSSQKKQAVEKAILKLEKKHPELKIQKARLLKSTAILFIFSFLSLFSPQKIQAQNVSSSKDFPPPLIIESPVSIYEWTINEKTNVDFSVNGYWQGEISGILQGSFENGSSFNLSPTVPIFKQEVDISAQFNLNNKWQFEADFADEFNKNTITFNYEGKKTLKSFKISNRNVFMNNSYSADYFGFGLIGGQNQAPGISLRFGDINDSPIWNGNSVLRYQTTSIKNATFYGQNSISDLKIPIRNFLTSNQFTIPVETSESLLNLENIYIETPYGEFSDQDGRKYKKLSSTDYKIFHKDGLVIINSSVSINANTSCRNTPSILLTFYSDSEVKKIIAAAGSYNDGLTFLGKIQEIFNLHTKKYNLAEYTKPLENKINGKSALQIQSPSGFSPFLCANVYDCGFVLDGDISVISKTTEQTQNLFFTSYSNTNINYEDFFSSQHKLAYIYNQEFNTDSYNEILQRFPFAVLDPEIYLNLEDNSDFSILYRNYTPVTNYDIGQNAISESVQVYINSQLDQGARYDKLTGYVYPTKTPSSTDKIYVTWQEESNDFSKGAIAAGSGIKINFIPNLTGDFSITTQWPLTITSNYATTENIHNGYVAAATGIEYKTENFNISNKTALAVKTENTTGTLMVSPGSSRFPQTHYFSISDGFATQNEPFIPMCSQKLLQNHNGTIKNHTGIKDSQISGYKIPVKWNFENINDYAWAAVDINLSDETELNNTSEFEIAIQPVFLQNSGDFQETEVYLQLGINTENSSIFYEPQNLPTWKLTGTDSTDVICSLNLLENKWQTIKIRLTDLDRSFLSKSSDARIIILKKGTDQANNEKGELYIGPYEAFTKTLFTQEDSDINVYSYSVPATDSPSCKNLFIMENSASKINWKILEPDFFEKKLLYNESISFISASKNFEPVNLSDYNYINLDFAWEKQSIVQTSCYSNCDFELTLDNHTGSMDLEGEIAVKVSIKNIESYLSENKWHTLQIDTNKKTVYIDNQKLSQNDFNINLNKKILPNRKKIRINTLNGNRLYTEGSFILDNLYFTETSPYLTVLNNLFAEIHNEGKILSASFSIDSSQSGVFFENSEKNVCESDTLLKGTFSVKDISLNSDINLYNSSSQSNVYIKSAGHTFKAEKLAWNILSFDQTFRTDKLTSATSKKDFLQLNFEKLKIPLIIQFQTSAVEQKYLQTQDINAKVELNINSDSLKISWKNNILANQKSYLFIDNSKPTYLDSYINISQNEFSTGDDNSDSRNISVSSVIETESSFLKIKPTLEYKAETFNIKTFPEQRKATDTTCINFSIPISLKNQTITVNLRRSSGIVKNSVLNKNYADDFYAYYATQSENLWLYNSIPFYDLFDENMPQKFDDLKFNYLEKIYSSYYELDWKRNFSSSITDFFVPIAANLCFSRTIDKSSIISDFYQIKSNLTYTSINNFGYYSKAKLFKWYEQDEFISNIFTAIKIPKTFDQNIIINMNFYFQGLLYFTSDKTFTSYVNFSFGNDNEWNIKNTAIYSYPGKSSLITLIPKIIFKNQKIKDENITKNENFNLEFDYKENLMTQKYGYNHTENIKIKNHYEISIGTGIELSHSKNKAFIFNGNLKLGGKMEF